VTQGGVQPPAKGSYLTRLARNAAKDPGEAVEAAGASAAETGVGLLAGKAATEAVRAGATQVVKQGAKSVAGRLFGSVAAALAAPEVVAGTAATGGLGALAAPAIEMGAFAAGAYLGDKATQYVEKLIGVDKELEKAKQDNPELAQVASLATMAPMAASSLKNLAKLPVGKAVQKVAGGAVGGAAFEPIRYGVESGLKAVTGSEDQVAPVTAKSLEESALMGAVLSAHGARKIEDTVGPATARAAVKAQTEPATEAKTEVTAPQENASGEPVQAFGPQRLQEAAFRATHPDTKETRIFRGENHDEAINKAFQAGFIDERTKNALSGNENAENRNTEEFGFVDQYGDFHNREKSARIAKDQGQLAVGEDEFDHYRTNASGEEVPLLHSHEVNLDRYTDIPRLTRQDVEAGKTVKDLLAEKGGEIKGAVKSRIQLVKDLREELSRETSEESKTKAPLFVKEPTGKILHHAALFDKSTGQIFQGSSHDNAAKKAADNAIRNQKKDPKGQFVKPDLVKGYMTENGEFVSQKKAMDLAKQGKQMGKDEQGNPKIKLAAYYQSGPKVGQPVKQRPELLYAARPAQAVRQQLYATLDNLALKEKLNRTHVGEVLDAMEGRTPNMSNNAYRTLEKAMRSMNLTHDDLDSLGIEIPELTNKDRILNGIRKNVYNFLDFVGNKTTPNLDRAGLLPEAYGLAYARPSVHKEIQDILAKTFSDYKDDNFMRETFDVINADNILGGYDEAKANLDDLNKRLVEARELAKTAEAPANIGKQIEAIVYERDRQKKTIQDIEKAHNLEDLNNKVEAAKANKEMVKSISRYSNLVTPFMEEVFSTVRGVKPGDKMENSSIEGTRGRHFGVRVNLLPESHVKTVEDFLDHDKKTPEIDVAKFRNPDVKMDKFLTQAKFTAAKYSNDPVLVLTNTLGSRLHEAAKIKFYDALVDKGVAYMTSVGQEGPKLIGGKPVTLLKKIEYPVYNEETGTTKKVEKNIYIQKDLKQETLTVLDAEEKGEMNPFVKNATLVQMVGIADATAHLKNIEGIVANSLGRDTKGKDLISKIPFVGSASALKEIMDVTKQVSADTPEIRAKIANLARQGLVRAAYPGEGSQRFLGMHDLIHKVDTAARLIMYDRYDNLVKNYGAIDTPEERIKFVNQVGEYNRRLMGRFESAMRDRGLSPFIVAGRAMNRFARRLITGEPGFRTETAKAAIEARATQMAGLVFASITPMLVNMMTTGTPYGRYGTPIGAIDLGEKMDTNDGKHRLVDVFQLVGLRRGLRAMGINAAVEGVRQGKTWSEISQDARNDAVTTALHPFVGPAAGFAVEAATGQRIDLRVGYGQTYEARKIDNAAGQYAENFRVALKHLNPVLYGLGQAPIQRGMEAMGIPKAADEDTPLASVAAGVSTSPLAALGVNLRGVVSPASKLASQLGTKVQYDPQQDIRYQARKKVNDLFRRGNKEGAAQLYQQYMSDGILTKADAKVLRQEFAEKNPLVRKVKQLKTAQDGLSVFRVADGPDQDDIAESVLNKIVNSTSLNNEEKKKLVEGFQKAIKKNSKLFADYGYQ
jgi:hypothetical protein